ncbi:hypothetical protein GQ457_01G023680 [Hibiscus cannabinus]
MGTCTTLFGLVSPDLAEVDAVLDGLQLACDRGWDMVVIESHSARVVNMLHQDPELDLCTIGPILDPIRSLLTAHPHFHVSFISRNVNVVAHTLATLALRCTQSLFFDSVFPKII